MTYTAPPAQPTSGQNPWYDTMSAWMDGVETALGEIDAHSALTAPHIPSGGSDGQVLTKVAGVPGWANPTGTGGTSDHGTLTGLSDADHPIVAVIGLQAALDAKAVVGHTHSGFDPAGTAASAVSAHAAAGDPHPGYLTPAEGAVLYAPLARQVPDGGTTGQVLAKTSNANGAVSWQTVAGGGVVAPLVLTSPNATDIALSAKGAVGQSVNISEVRNSDNTVLWATGADGTVRMGTNISNQNGQMRTGIADPARQGWFLRLAAGQTAKAVQIVDSALAEKFNIDKDGNVTGKNVGGIFKSVVVLDAAEAVPTGLPVETVLLRRPAA